MATYAERIKNHKKLTITRRRNGETIVIHDTKPGDGRKTGKILAGMPITNAIDDSLDSFVFTYKGADTMELLKPFELVTFTVDDGSVVSEYEMVVAFDRVHEISKEVRLFDHTVTLIESTKILEKVKIFSLNLTNPYDTLLTQFEKALTNAELVVRSERDLGHGQTALNFERKCRFAISAPLRALLTGKPSGDFFNGNTDLRSVLDNMLAPLNARVEVTKISFYGADISQITLGYRSMTATQAVTPTWTRGAHGEIACIDAENDGQDAAGKIVARGFNTISPEPLTFTGTFKSSNATITDATACVCFPFPISERGIEKFIIHTYVDGYDWEMHLYDIDIANHLIPRESFNLLSEGEQKTFIPFDIGSQVVEIGSCTGKFLWYYTSGIVNIIKQCAVEQYGVQFTVLQYYDLSFTITYYPQVDTVAEVPKPNTYDRDDLLLGIQDSQSENTLDMERHGRRLDGLIRRTGNDSFFIDVVADKYGTLLPLMAKIELPADKAGYTDGGYVVYKREIAIYDMFVQCRYYLSKDFNAVQEFAGVRREKHLYDIPLESEEAPIVLHKYLEFGYSLNGFTGEYGFDRDLVKSALGILVGQNEGKNYYIEPEHFTTGGKLNYLLFRSCRGDRIYPLDTENSKNEYPYHTNAMNAFLLPLVTYGQAHNMNFVARTLDNYSVDYSRDGYLFSIWGDKGNMVTYNRYVDNSQEHAGECDEFRLNFAFDCKPLAHSDLYTEVTEGGEPTDYQSILNRFPIISEDLCVKATTSDIKISYYKDRTQRPLFCFILSCVPCAADYGDRYVGTAFCRENNLVRNNGAGLSARMYVSDTQRFEGQEDWLPPVGYIQIGSPSDYFSLSTIPTGGATGSIGPAVYCLKRNAERIGGDPYSWAITNERGEIYLAGNGEPRDIYVWIKDFPE